LPSRLSTAVSRGGHSFGQGQEVQPRGAGRLRAASIDRTVARCSWSRWYFRSFSWYDAVFMVQTSVCGGPSVRSSGPGRNGGGGLTVASLGLRGGHRQFSGDSHPEWPRQNRRLGCPPDGGRRGAGRPRTAWRCGGRRTSNPRFANPPLAAAPLPGPRSAERRNGVPHRSGPRWSHQSGDLVSAFEPSFPSAFLEWFSLDPPQKWTRSPKRARNASSELVRKQLPSR
jgi:hypothetical protein